MFDYKAVMHDKAAAGLSVADTHIERAMDRLYHRGKNKAASPADVAEARKWIKEARDGLGQVLECYLPPEHEEEPHA